MLRERLGLAIRDVEVASADIAQKRGDARYQISRSAISDIENADAVPGMHKMYSLASIYRRRIVDLLEFYGIDDPAQEPSIALPDTHLANPLRLSSQRQSEGGVDFRETKLLPMAYLNHLFQADCKYGYIGRSDRMMYPLLVPGSLVQIDDTKKVILEGGWRNEYERPIYFLETRDRFFCCWCERNGDSLLLVRHPLSPERTRVYAYRNEVQVIGQVVAVAMRLVASRLAPTQSG